MVAACAHRAPPRTTITSAGEVASPAPVTPTRWTASIAPLVSTAVGGTGGTGAPSEVQGRAAITPGTNGQPDTIVLFLTGLQPGQPYIWHIRRGPCSSTEPQGPPSEYAPLTVDAEGRGSATGTFPMTDMHGYHIDVHLGNSPALACGDLKPVTP